MKEDEVCQIAAMGKVLGLLCVALAVLHIPEQLYARFTHGRNHSADRDAGAQNSRPTLKKSL